MATSTKTEYDERRDIFKHEAYAILSLGSDYSEVKCQLSKSRGLLRWIRNPIQLSCAFKFLAVYVYVWYVHKNSQDTH